MAMRAAGLVVLGLLICILALVAGGAWIFYTPSGLQWLAARAAAFTGERLESRGVSGTLAAGAHADEIAFTTDALSVRVRQARFTLSPWSLLTLSAEVADLGAERIEVRTTLVV